MNNVDDLFLLPRCATKTFADLYSTATAFTTDYSTINLGGITDSTLLNKLYYLLFSE